MRSKAKDIEDCAMLFEIEIKKETIAKAFDEVYDEISKIANIPGFRVGKAPRELVKKHYEKDAKHEVLKRLIPQAYERALKEHNVSPITLPDISEVDFKNNAALTFKARVETWPRFKLKDYKELSVQKKKIAVKGEDIDSTLNNLREINAKYATIDNRAVQKGDYVVSDLECFVDGKPAHKKRENLWLYVDKDALVPELAEKMVGMNKAEEKDIEVKLPEKYPDKDLAGKMARYHIRAKEIKMRILPSLDDEFAKDLGKDNLEGLKKEIGAELERKMALDIEIDMENQILNKLMDDNRFAVPQSFVKRQLDFMVRDLKERLMAKGVKKEDIDKKENEFIEKFKDDAVRQVRLLFILHEIAKENKIEVGEKDVEAAYKSIAAKTGQGEDRVKDYYEKEGWVDSLKDKIREEKTIKFLLANAKKVEEV